jgi:hypothetical protein
MINNSKFKIGNIYNNWTLLDITYSSPKNYKFQCNCGFIKNTSNPYNILNNNSKKCVTCANKDKWGDYSGLPNRTWVTITKTARKRNIEFNISKDYAEKILINQNYKCALTKLELKFVFAPYNIMKEVCNNCNTASLDRIDSSKGYIEGNIQWVHKDVNLMKNILNQDYFISLCKQIANNN